MNKSNLYIYNQRIVDETSYVRYASLLKVLYRLKVINQTQVIELMMEFKPFIV